MKLEHPIFKIVQEAAKELNVECYLIGGYVRDLILKRKSKDIDFLVIGNGVEFAEYVNKKIHPGKKIAIFKNFGTAMFNFDDFEIEFVGARKESYRSDSRKPIVEDGTLSDDQNRRDFTINTLAISLNEKNLFELIDPFEGIKDLEKKVLRTPLDPDITYSDDPLRMLRAIRFASQLGFKIDPISLKSIEKNKNRVSQ